MIFIYYFKNILSIKDNETILAPLTEQYFSDTKGLSITDIYSDICELEKSRIWNMQKDVTHSYNAAMEMFQDIPDKEQRNLQIFAFICNLSFDVYVKKQIIEKLIDELPKPEERKKRSKNFTYFFFSILIKFFVILSYKRFILHSALPS